MSDEGGSLWNVVVILELKVATCTCTCLPCLFV